MSKNKDLEELVDKLDFVDVYINATHLNFINDNSLLYTIDAATTGGKSWTTPYKKPQLLHHDKHKDAVGRVMAYTIEDKATVKGEPKDFIKLKVRVTDSDAISKVIKGIYYTCSVGSSTSSVRCSICDQVLTTDGLCEHEKGTMFEGKRVYWIVDNISYRENSFVNNPADSYSRIVSIDIGDGQMAYEKFLDDKENILTEFFMEDNMKQNTKKTDRSKIAESAFCGPSKTFPATDEAHVIAGLKLLKQSELSDSAKQKVTGALYRKGKRYGVEPLEDELKENGDLLVYRMNEDFTEDEIQEFNDFFKSNPDADLIVEDEDSSDSEPKTEPTFKVEDFAEIKKGKKDEIIAFADFIIAELKTLQDDKDALVVSETELKDKISEQTTILNSKEDEINKLLDDNADVSVKYKHSLIDNILDFKKVIENRDEEFKKFDSRKTESLADTLADFRNESSNSIPKVNDETLTDSSESDNDNNSDGLIDNEDSHKSRIDRFFKKNILMEG